MSEFLYSLTVLISRLNIECPERSDCHQTWHMNMDMDMDMNMNMFIIKWNFQIINNRR